MFGRTFWLLVSTFASGTLETRRGVAVSENGDLTLSSAGVLQIENDSLNGTNGRRHGVIDHKALPASNVSPSNAYLDEENADLRKRIVDPISRFLEAHGVQSGRSCSENSQLQNLGCFSRCHCGLGMRCYPKHVIIDESLESNIGICQFSMTIFTLLSLAIFFGVLSCVIGLRTYLRFREAEELHLDVGLSSKQFQFAVEDSPTATKFVKSFYNEAIHSEVSDG